MLAVLDKLVVELQAVLVVLEQIIAEHLELVTVYQDYLPVAVAVVTTHMGGKATRLARVVLAVVEGTVL